MDAYGRITVRGRLKTMILGASGENIYPEEIEAVLNSSPYVLESLVYGDAKGLTALVHLKPEVLESLKSRIQDEIEGAELAAASWPPPSARRPNSSDGIRREANCRLAAFSRLARVEIQELPFEKTPKQSIKRFLYDSQTRGHTK